ncbi:hypothetical protein [Lactococcus protaetiae]|uniref:hypothetical protein n=1 Tax=Lactococcus protaetiae TaxID=2592653 RepID=UPI0016819E03|nr:hypothetical protein [Lactococcus protaetiae]
MYHNNAQSVSILTEISDQLIFPLSGLFNAQFNRIELTEFSVKKNTDRFLSV